jgi:hypothetical protein
MPHVAGSACWFTPSFPMEAVSSSETLVVFRRTTKRYYAPEDRTLAKCAETDLLNTTVLYGVHFGESSVFQMNIPLPSSGSKSVRRMKPAGTRGVSVWRRYVRSFSDLVGVTTESPLWKLEIQPYTYQKYIFLFCYPEDLCFSLCERNWIGT